jgi:hypothetical protein
MSLKFEIADWRFEVTWDGMLCQPLERGRAKGAKRPAELPNRANQVDRARRGTAPSLELAAKPFNNPQRKGATK